MLKIEREISEKRVKKMHMPFGKLSFNVKIRSVMAFIPHNLTERTAYTQNMCTIQHIMCKWMIMCFFRTNSKVIFWSKIGITSFYGFVFERSRQSKPCSHTPHYPCRKQFQAMFNLWLSSLKSVCFTLFFSVFLITSNEKIK